MFIHVDASVQQHFSSASFILKWGHPKSPWATIPQVISTILEDLDRYAPTGDLEEERALLEALRAAIADGIRRPLQHLGIPPGGHPHPEPYREHWLHCYNDLSPEDKLALEADQNKYIAYRKKCVPAQVGNGWVLQYEPYLLRCSTGLMEVTDSMNIVLDYICTDVFKTTHRVLNGYEWALLQRTKKRVYPLRPVGRGCGA